MVIKTWKDITHLEDDRKRKEYYSIPEVQHKNMIIFIFLLLIILAIVIFYHYYEIQAINECANDPNANMFWHTVCKDIKTTRGI